MQVKGRIFPYPVLNNNPVFSGFKSESFSLNYEAVEDESNYTLKDLTFATESKAINSLFKEGKIGICLIVECSDTVYRKKFELTEKTKDIVLKKVDFVEKVCISLFAYAKEDFKLVSEEFDDDYKGIDFQIEKYDIVAANDGFTVSFRHDESSDNVVKSIFSIIVDHDKEDGPYSVDCDTNPRKIIVALSEKDFKNYQIVNTAPDYREVFFCMLLVPALQDALNNCLNLIKHDHKELDDICGQYFWFHSIMTAYKRLVGKDLTAEELQNTPASLLSQMLLGNPLEVSMEKLVNALKGTGDDENE